MSTAPDDPRPSPAQVATTRYAVRVRRAPKYSVFIFGGIVIGVVVTFIAVSQAPGRNDDNTPFAQAFGYFVLYGIAFGALLGAIVAVFVDWISGRRARTVQTEREHRSIDRGDEVLDGDLEP